MHPQHRYSAVVNVGVPREGCAGFRGYNCGKSACDAFIPQEEIVTTELITRQESRDTAFVLLRRGP